jgi:hypothetical protein
MTTPVTFLINEKLSLEEQAALNRQVKRLLDGLRFLTAAWNLGRGRSIRDRSIIQLNE